ncbi:MAG: SDR family NAD(P)-dependent oxidoreductase [Legionellaceae bacterium]|nr:SDR family NAD(P)-dependent oxidoreductase [Legionellaceae bacterium]
MLKNIAIIGGTGSIGLAFTKQLAALHPTASIQVFSRSTPHTPTSHIHHHRIDYRSEASIAAAAQLACQDAPLDLIIVATGLLHEDTLKPEKSLHELSAEKFQRVFEVNTILPALIAKHFLPQLSRDHRAVFAALSARVGSISDNKLGGWYAYRASKAALNMVLKNAALEMGRRNRHAIVVGLHPGTVDSRLSKPFQANIAQEKIFTPDFSVSKMLEVLARLTPQDSGRCFAWDGQEIAP